MSEGLIQKQVAIALSKQPGVRIFRNQVGQGWVGKFAGNLGNGRILLENARRVSFGLQPGSGDLIGWKTIAGRAIFLSAEVKTDTGRMSHEQVNWLDFVRKSGEIGRAHV